MACVTRGSSLTSPLLPKEVEDHLPPLADYALPGEDSGLTDVRVRYHRARTLWVGVWLHRMDMALSGEAEASRSLIQSRHSRGLLLNYFLAPGTANLCYEEVIDQVHENVEMHERRRWDSASSLRKCLSWRTKLHDELDAVSRSLEMTQDRKAQKEMEQRIDVIKTSLNKVETSILKYENLIEESRILEEEAHHEGWGQSDSGKEA